LDERETEADYQKRGGHEKIHDLLPERGRKGRKTSSFNDNKTIEPNLQKRNYKP